MNIKNEQFVKNLLAKANNDYESIIGLLNMKNPKTEILIDLLTCLAGKSVIYFTYII